MYTAEAIRATKTVKGEMQHKKMKCLQTLSFFPVLSLVALVGERICTQTALSLLFFQPNPRIANQRAFQIDQNLTVFDTYGILPLHRDK